MLISRTDLLAKLNEASPGVSQKEQLEQSNCFVFADGRLTTFNEEIMVRLASPLDFNAIVPATPLLEILSKIPDDEIEISLKESEIRIKGKRKSAGIACQIEVSLPIDKVPSPESWGRLGEGTTAAMQQAAAVCSTDETQYLTTCVHLTDKLVEACDNFSLLRHTIKTGIEGDIVVPAKSIAALEHLEIKKVAMAEGWVHFKTSSGAQISLRCSHGGYLKGVDGLLVMENEEKLTLPGNLGEILERAEVFSTATYDTKVRLKIAEGELDITSRKEGGWYRERKKIRYAGRPLEFEINPKYLVDVLSRTRDVVVDRRRMKIESGNAQFVVALQAKADKPEQE